MLLIIPFITSAIGFSAGVLFNKLHFYYLQKKSFNINNNQYNDNECIKCIDQFNDQCADPKLLMMMIETLCNIINNKSCT